MHVDRQDYYPLVGDMVIKRWSSNNIVLYPTLPWSYHLLFRIQLSFPADNCAKSPSLLWQMLQKTLMDQLKRKDKEKTKKSKYQVFLLKTNHLVILQRGSVAEYSARWICNHIMLWPLGRFFSVISSWTPRPSLWIVLFELFVSDICFTSQAFVLQILPRVLTKNIIIIWEGRL